MDSLYITGGGNFRGPGVCSLRGQYYFRGPGVSNLEDEIEGGAWAGYSKNLPDFFPHQNVEISRFGAPPPVFTRGGVGVSMKEQGVVENYTNIRGGY